MRSKGSDVLSLQVLREKMKECFATHGVNHDVECKDIADKYQEAQRVRVRSSALAEFEHACLCHRHAWHCLDDVSILRQCAW